MYTSEKVKAYNYVRNCDVRLHSEEELSHLQKKGIIGEDVVKANQRLV